MKTKIMAWLVSILCVLPAATAMAAQPTKQSPDEAAPYEVTGGKAGFPVYLGWRVFHSACYVCHGVGGVGTAVAPDLTQRVKTMTPIDFVVAVLFRYPIIVGAEVYDAQDLPRLREFFTSEINRREAGRVTMPSWEDDPEVEAHVMDIYAYLRARADGALGAQRPEPLDQGN